MDIKAVIFDMDGVLTKSMNSHVKSWKKALKKFNITPLRKDLLLLEGLNYKETIKILSKKYNVILNEKQEDEVYSIKKESLGKMNLPKIYSGVNITLKLLKNKNIKCALVTGADKKFALKLVGDKFPNYFKTVITGNDVKIGKPGPEPYLLALKRLKLNSKQAIVIENSPLGIKSAKSAKIITYALTTTLNKKYLGQADKIFRNHKDLYDFLKNNIA